MAYFYITDDASFKARTQECETCRRWRGLRDQERLYGNVWLPVSEEG